ncbi:MAG: GNAT family N-acetyltransferase [Planctomycetota bacterium]
MGDDLVWQTTDTPVKADDGVVDAGLSAHNRAAGVLEGVRPLRCYARTASGQVVGGALAQTLGECCSLDILWVDEALRGRGIGAELVGRVEAEAAQRGCRLVFLESFSFQAPRFYERLGYERLCAFPGFPDGAVKYVMQKRLSEPTDGEQDDG